jgi:hypothetical protein
MQADFSVELGREDPALELPWISPEKHVRYYDLKHHPELVQQIPEAVAHPELGSFLSRINAAGFPLATAKCDAWSSREVAPEEEIFGDRKFVSYIDIVFVSEADRCSFEKHEWLAKELCRLLVRAPEIPAAVELVIRHCYYHKQDLVHETANSLNYSRPNESAGSETNFQSEAKVGSEDARISFTGFCLTAYVTGFGDSDNNPVRRWSIGLRLLNHALVQLNCNA